MVCAERDAMESALRQAWKGREGAPRRFIAPLSLTLANGRTVHLRGISLGADMRGADWEDVLIAVYQPEPLQGRAHVSGRFNLERDTVHAAVIDERTPEDDPAAREFTWRVTVISDDLTNVTGFVSLYNPT